MGMPRLRHVPAILFSSTSLIVVACAQAPAQAPAQPEDQARVQQQAGYPQQPPGQYATPAATAAPGMYPGGDVFSGLAEAPASDVAGLQAQLDRAEQALGLVLGSRSTADAATPAPAATGTAATPGTPVSADPCLVACAALASMKRSADHLCGMAGEGDATCGGARERVQRAEQRVTQACPACASR